MTDFKTSPPPLIPREILFGNPEKAQPRLSPDSNRLAYLAPVDGVMNVWVGPVGSPVGGEGAKRSKWYIALSHGAPSPRAL
jgi:hypothetical protein